MDHIDPDSADIYREIDEENPLRWYYPCVCGCLRKRRINMNFVDDENDNEVETPLLSKGLGG